MQNAQLAELELPVPAAGQSFRGAKEFLAVGGLTPLLFLLGWALRRGVGLDDAELAAGFTTFYGAFLINDPHFSVTYFLFYRNARARAFGDAFSRGQRIRYVLAGVVTPVLLALWGGAAITMKSAYIMGLFIQLMFLLVGWHYVKQGFGVMTVLSARRGVRFTARERMALLAHCYAGWAYAWASPFDPGRQVEEKGVVYMTIAHPRGLEMATFVVFLATGAAVVWVLARKRMREGQLPVTTPLLGMLCSVWVWSVYSAADPVLRYFIPALHSIQYLYFVWLLRGNEAREKEGPPDFEMSAKARLGILAVSALGLVWLLFHGAPTYLDDLFVNKKAMFDHPLGPTPYFAALYTFVNVHHFAMDAVIWRKGNPETRYLLQ